MTLGKIVNALPVLRKLAEEKLTVKTAYWLDKALRGLESETRFFDEKRNALVQKYGTDIGGGKWKIDEDKAEDFSREMNELLNLEVESDYKIVKIPTTENITLSCNDLRLVEGLVELELVES